MATRASTKRGGANPYRKGAAHEREVAGFLRELGALVVRSPQSGQAMDLTVLWPSVHHHFREQFPGDPGHPDDYIRDFSFVTGPKPWLVQCKLAGYMRPAEREELISLAKQYGARPILVGRKPFVFIDLTSGGQVEPPPYSDSIAPTAPDELPLGADPV